MKTATQRIKHYLNERNKMSAIDKQSIHGLHTGHETREAELTQSDIREVLRENAELRELLRESLPTIDGDMADAWRTGLKERISTALANVAISQPEDKA